MEKVKTPEADQKTEAPVIHWEHNGVEITITFAEKPGDNNVKDRILDLLMDAYEKRIRTEQ